MGVVGDYLRGLIKKELDVVAGDIRDPLVFCREVTQGLS